MKTIDELTEKAVQLQSSGLSTGQIADELNVSRETATWLLAHSKKKEITQVPKDIYIDWSAIGKSSYRLRYVSQALADMVLESLEKSEQGVDVVVGVVLSGIPLASMIADELGVEFATYHPNKQRWEPESTVSRGTVSQNFAKVDGKDCVIVDDVITTGTTLAEAVKVIDELGGNPTAIVVLIDKKGVDTLGGVPVNSLMRVTRVDKAE